MLWSAGLELPRCVFGHGFVTAADGQKMSKSIGNVVDPVAVLARFPADSFRYYLMRCGSYGSDVPYNEAMLTAIHNSDLADVLGNLIHRLANLAARMCDGVVPDCAADAVFDLPRLRGTTEGFFARFDLQARERALNWRHSVTRELGQDSPWSLCRAHVRRLFRQ